MKRARVGVLVSGRGSNMMALIDAAQSADFPAEIAVVISNRPDALALETATERGVPAVCVDHKVFDTRELFEQQLDRALRADRIDIICLAGFMRILSPWFVGQWEGRILNIHPSLLPSFPGLDTHKRALDAGVKFHGCTVHLVTRELDRGPIIDQAAIAVRPDDTPDTLAARVLTAEHELYPACLAKVARERINASEDEQAGRSEAG